MAVVHTLVIFFTIWKLFYLWALPAFSRFGKKIFYDWETGTLKMTPNIETFRKGKKKWLWLEPQPLFRSISKNVEKPVLETIPTDPPHPTE